ncbi:MAG: AMP-binding protein [Rhodocyclaceae bacterium]|nr:AMP-binding protein [Rhodocyclaceae bacterium]
MTIRSPGARAPQIAKTDLPLQRFYHWEATSPDKIYFTQPFDGGQLREYSWRQVGIETRKVAAWLQAQGWEPGSKVAILGKNSAGWIMADLAIWMAGYVSVPLYPLLTADNILQIANHSESVACFVGKLDDIGLLGGVPEGMTIITLPLAPEAVAKRATTDWDTIVATTEPLAGSPVRHGGDLATLVYTSGTTGTAKGAMHSFDTLAAGLLTVVAHSDYTPEDRALSYLPLAHIMERSVLELSSLYFGYQVFFAESLTSFATDLRRARPNAFVSVPRLWLKFQQGILAKIPQKKLSRMLKTPVLGYFVRRKIVKQLGLDHARLIGSGSALMASDLIEWYKALGLEMHEGYGMTELGCTSHSTKVGGHAPGTVGMAADGVDHRIDPETGEVQVLSPAATLGYYKAPELTAELFTADGWLKTGDKGVIDANDRLTIVGRIKDNFKTSKGKYVAPGPIEHKLSQHEAIDSCLVVGSSMSQPLGLIVLNEVAVRELAQNKPKLVAEFSAHLDKINATLDAHEQLDCVAVTTKAWTPENGLLTPTLKVKRAQIEARFANDFEGWAKRREKVVWVD